MLFDIPLSSSTKFSVFACFFQFFLLFTTSFYFTGNLHMVRGV